MLDCAKAVETLWQRNIREALETGQANGYNKVSQHDPKLTLMVDLRGGPEFSVR